MSLVEIYEEFLVLEEDLDLLSKRIKGVYFWERVRSDVYRQILRKKGIREKAHDEPNSSPFDQVAKLGSMLKNLIIKNPFIGGRSDFLFIGHPRRKKQEDGVWEDVYCDPLIQEIEETEKYSYTYFEGPHNSKHFKPPKTKVIRYLDLVTYSTALLEKLGVNSKKISEEEKKLIQRIESRVKEVFGVQINLEEKIHQKVNLHYLRKPIWSFILQKTRPKLALVVSSPGKETFLQACEENNVKTAEIQHGIIDKYHIGYNYPNKDKNIFVDYFLTYSNFWSENTSLPIKSDKIVEIGWPYFYRKRNRYSDLEAKNQILIISQNSVGSELSKIALEISEEFDDYNIIFKLHPGEVQNWRSKYPKLVERSNIEVIGGEVPLYKLFAESKCQIGFYSTALFEGIGVGLPTLVYGDFKDNPFVNIFKSVGAHSYDSIEDLEHVLSLNRSLENKGGVKNVSEVLFGSQKNCEFLDFLKLVEAEQKR